MPVIYNKKDKRRDHCLSRGANQDNRVKRMAYHDDERVLLEKPCVEVCHKAHRQRAHSGRDVALVRKLDPCKVIRDPPDARYGHQHSSPQAVLITKRTGFGLAIGSSAFSKLSGHPLQGQDDLMCSLSHPVDGPWYQRTPSIAWGLCHSAASPNPRRC